MNLPEEKAIFIAKAAAARISELEAALVAYASEFPLDAEGEPDVGNIHANIRALKKKIAAPVVQGERKLVGHVPRFILRKAMTRDGFYISTAIHRDPNTAHDTVPIYVDGDFV